MTVRSRTVRWRRLAGTAVMTALLTAVAAPAFAASPTKSRVSPFSTASMEKAVAPAVTAAPAAAPAKAPAKAPQSGSQSFFKTKTGLLVLGVFAVGTGYAIYSAKEDRIRGLNR